MGYTLGQVFFTTSQGTPGTIAAGIQQPYEIATVVRNSELSEHEPAVMVFPNPSSRFLTLKMDAAGKDLYTYTLYDQYGKILINNNISSDQVLIDLGWLVPSFYLLRVSRGKHILQTFKIIKR